MFATKDNHVKKKIPRWLAALFSSAALPRRVSRNVRDSVKKYFFLLFG